METAQHKRGYIGFAFRQSIPIMLGYIFLGIAFGLLLQNAGYSFWWAFLTSVVIYAGSMQFVLVSLLPGGAGLVYGALMTLFINGRHIPYYAARKCRRVWMRIRSFYGYCCWIRVIGFWDRYWGIAWYYMAASSGTGPVHSSGIVFLCSDSFRSAWESDGCSGEVKGDGIEMTISVEQSVI